MMSKVDLAAMLCTLQFNRQTKRMRCGSEVRLTVAISPKSERLGLENTVL